MKNFIIILLLLAAIPACEIESYLLQEKEIEVGNIYDYNFEGSEEIPEFEDYYEVMTWILSNFKYTLENGDYWQTPEETFYLRNENNKMIGDCEDFSILLQFIIEKQFNVKTVLYIIKYSDGSQHAVAYFNNKFYDFTIDGNYMIYNHLTNDIEIMHVISYSEVIWMTVNYHDNVGRYK
jgi:uncharacterized protein (DUF2164 family)